MVENEYESLLHGYPADLRKYLDVIRPRARDVQTNSFVNVGTANFGSWLTVRAYVIVFKIPLLMCSCCIASKYALCLWHFSDCED
jgi:hypothetical protein